MKKLVAFLLLFSLVASGGCGGGGDEDKREKTYQISGRVYDFSKYAESARIELWTLDRETMLASTDLFTSFYNEDITYFSFPEDEKFAGRLLLSADVEGLGKMLGIADATQPTVESITPLSTLVLEVAEGNYSENEVGKAEGLVSAFIGVASDDDYCSKSVLGIVPIGGEFGGVEDELLAFDPTGFSYPVFERELLPDGSKTFNEAIAEWAARAKRGETLARPLVSSNPAFPLPGPGPVPVPVKKPGFIAWGLKAIGKGALAYGGGEILGLVLKFIIDAPDNKDIMRELKEMSRKLDEIQRTLNRLDAELKSILAGLKVDIAYGRMSTRVDDIRTAYNKHLLDIATDKSTDKTYRQGLVKKFISYYEMKIDADILALHANLTGDTFDGKAFYKLMADNALAAIRAGSMTMESAVERYVFAYTFFVGVQLKGLICKVEILNKNATNETDRKTKVLKEINDYKERMQKQATMFLDNAELLVTAAAQNAGGTFDNREESWMPMRPKTIHDNPYYYIDEVAGDSLGFETQVVFRLLFDPNAPDNVSAAGWDNSKGEGWWHDVYIRDYRSYFKNTGVKGMMQKLANNASGKHLPVYLQNRGTKKNIKSTNGDGFGSVQTFSWKELAQNNPRDKTAVVLRWVFAGDDVTSKDTYRIAVDDKAKSFYIDPNTIYRKGTIGSNIIRTEQISEGANKEPWCVKMVSGDTFSSITTFAWLPERLSYYPHEGNNDNDIMRKNHKIAMETLSRKVQGANAYVGELTTKDHESTHWLTCDSAASEQVVFVPRNDYNRNENLFQGQQMIYWARRNNQGGWLGWLTLSISSFAYAMESAAADVMYFVNLPTLVETFLNANSYLWNAKEKIHLRYGYPVFIGEWYKSDRGYWHWDVGNTGHTLIKVPLGARTDSNAYWYVWRNMDGF